jgi:Raf kinase inhibitor-like YbhB/YbcL family protein
MRRSASLVVVLLTLALLSACGGGGGSSAWGGGEPPPRAGLTVSSPLVNEGGTLPALYCAYGGNQSPPLTIAGVPVGTAGLVLICDDPDAVGAFGATYVHWLLTDLPGGTTALAGNADVGGLPVGTRRGRNSGDGIGWEGPSPPSGERHRYHLRVYALSTRPLAIDLGRTWTRVQFEAVYASSIMASGELSFVVVGPPG